MTEGTTGISEDKPTAETLDPTRALLSESGLWTSIRMRPFGKVPALDETPGAIFVTAIDTHPLAGSVEHGLAGREDDFTHGLGVIAGLTDGKTYLCKAQGSKIPSADGIEVAEFAGMHPAGLAGTHIHMLEPASRNHVAWHLGWQDVIAIGHLFKTGQLDTSRVIAVGGPGAQSPRLLRPASGHA